MSAIEREPVLSVSGVMMFVQSVIVWLTVSGRLTWTDEESQAFMQMLEAGLPYLLSVGNLAIGAVLARSQVYPAKTVERLMAGRAGK